MAHSSLEYHPHLRLVDGSVDNIPHPFSVTFPLAICEHTISQLPPLSSVIKVLIGALVSSGLFLTYWLAIIVPFTPSI